MRYMMIRTENLTKMIGHRLIVNNLSLMVEPGETYGFLGPNRSGKTTTIRMLLNYVHPTSGRALVLGLDSRRYDYTIRQQIGYAPADCVLRGRQNGAEMLHNLAKLRRGVDWDYVEELASKFDLDLSTPLDQLNAEGRQKLTLIQAFMHRPELIILDEPSKTLGLQSRQVLYQLIHNARAEGRTTFLSSSILAEMERLCDRVAVIHQGSLIAIERGVQLRNRAMRFIELRFAAPVPPEAFANVANLQNLKIEDNILRCTVCGDPDALIKAASQYRIVDFVSQALNLEEVFQRYYGVKGYAAS